MGITAGAEDVKYQAKYRDLKKKVKEIESVSHTQSSFRRCDPNRVHVTRSVPVGQ